MEQPEESALDLILEVMLVILAAVAVAILIQSVRYLI
jgi:hypothetical protein